MASNFFQKIAITAAGAVLSIAAIKTTPATAATIKYDLTINFFDTEEEASGSFSYDDSTIDINEPFGVGLTDFFLNFRGNTLTKSNADAFGISFVQYGRFEFAECPEDCGTDLIGIGVWDEWRFDFQIEYRGGGILFLEPSDAEPGDYIAVGNVGVFKTEKPDEVTSVPESGAGVSLLGLGAVGLVGLLRKKLASGLTPKLPLNPHP